MNPNSTDRKMQTLIFSFMLFICISTSCSSQKADHYSVIKYKDVGASAHENFVYSNQVLNYQGHFFKPLFKSNYRRDTLALVTVYKGEGTIDYSMADLQKDTLFMSYLELPAIRTIKLSNKTVIDNKRTYPIAYQNQDSTFCLTKDLLNVYIISKK